MPRTNRWKQPMKLCRMVTTGLAAIRQQPPPPQCERTASKLRYVVRRLNELVPAAFPVELLLTSSSLFDGWCGRSEEKFEIAMYGGFPLDQAIAVVIHEYAHALAWNLLDDARGRDADVSEDEFERLTHGPTWGVAVSEVYLAYITEIRPNLEH
jgi:hypothetical protein